MELSRFLPEKRAKQNSNKFSFALLQQHGSKCGTADGAHQRGISRHLQGRSVIVVPDRDGGPVLDKHERDIFAARYCTEMQRCAALLSLRIHFGPISATPESAREQTLLDRRRTLAAWRQHRGFGAGMQHGAASCHPSPQCRLRRRAWPGARSPPTCLQEDYLGSLTIKGVAHKPSLAAMCSPVSPLKLRLFTE